MKIDPVMKKLLHDRHSWIKKFNDDGSSHFECKDCGKIMKIPKKIAKEHGLLPVKPSKSPGTTLWA